MFSTLQPCIETLTIFLLALWLFTSTFPFRYKSIYPHKCTWLPKISHLLGELYFLLVAYTILTRNTEAVRSTEFPSSETLAVEFQASNLRAFAAMDRDRVMRFLDLHHSRDWFVWFWREARVFDELLEERAMRRGIPFDLLHLEIGEGRDLLKEGAARFTGSGGGLMVGCVMFWIGRIGGNHSGWQLKWL